MAVKVTKRCNSCGKEFEVEGYRAETAKFCSKSCMNKGKLSKAIDRMEELIGEPLGDFLEREYKVNQKTYRWLKDELKTEARTIKKLLDFYNIEIRHGSEAVKTQWINNDERKKKQGEIFGEYHKGRESHRRIKEDELIKRLKESDLKFIEREIKDGRTYIRTECMKCGSAVVTNINVSFGCAKCAFERQAKEQRTPFEVVQKTFDEQGMVLMSTTYERLNQKLKFICPIHAAYGEQERSYWGIKINGACKYCSRERKLVKKALPARRLMAVELSEWRMAVFKRDNFICQCCGYDKGGILRAHHIKNFSSYPHLRLDIDNGITLCENCHDPHIKGSFHSIYGTKNNTEEQLLEYINNKKKSLA